MDRKDRISSKQPDISLIIPCYNTDRYLDVCLSGIRVQTEPDIEILLIDDGSTDATGAILDRYAASDERATVIHTANHGVSAARNLGLSIAKGRYISFADADDAFEEHALAILFTEAEKSGAEIVSAGHMLFDTKMQMRTRVEETGISENPREVVRRIIHMHRVYNNIWNKLYKADLFADGLKLDESVHIGEDALLNLQLYLRARRIVHIPEYTYVYRVHDRSAMARIGDYCEAHQPMLNAMNRILLAAGEKGTYFRDFLESAVWFHEKETGIFAAMKQFNAKIRPLVTEGLQERDIPREDRRLFLTVQRGCFPAWYVSRRVLRKLERRKGDRF